MPKDMMNTPHRYPYWDSDATPAEVEAARRMLAGETDLLEMLGL